MYQNGWTVPETTILIALFSLGWFLAGLLVGRRIQAPGAGPQQPPRKARGGEGRKNGKGRAERGGARGGAAGGDVVEIYVGNLSYEITEKELNELFAQYGRVQSVRLITNKFNGKSKGFGFVEMPDRGQAKAAIRALEGKEFKGRKLVANEARSRARDQKE